MHFVGMLAFHLPVPIFYYWPTTLVALIIAIVASAAALYIVSLKRMSFNYAVISGCILGCGVAALHYLGMSAMRCAATYKLRPAIVAAAVALGVVFAIGGMWLGYHFRGEPKQTHFGRLGSALCMGSAIAGMHYTGMASAIFTPSQMPALGHTVHVSSLGTIGIAAVILMLLGTTIAACAVGRSFDAQSGRLALSESLLEFTHVTRLTIMGELTASIAHEIRQPLAAIVTNANYSLRELSARNPNIQEVREAVREIVDDGNRVSSIISRIRSLLRKEPSEQVDLDVNEVLQEVVDLLRKEVEQSSIHLTLELGEALPRIRGDRVQLQQAIMNVVLNGIEALRSIPQERRQLLIRSTEDSGLVLIDIMDAGPGIDPATAERLFEPFFTSKPHGMGLGLSISRSIAESHGGELSYYPAPEGALFRFTLPAETENSDG
jgi:signal transduction histidine kinase